MNCIMNKLSFPAFLLIFFFGLSLFGAEDAKSWKRQLDTLAQPQCWIKRNAMPAITADALDESIEGMRIYYQNHQLTEGNFRYGLDLTDDIEIDDDNAVRQAGALWGLAVLNRERFTENTRRQLLLGLDFFIRAMRPVQDGTQMVVTYQSNRKIKTGMVALFCLAVTDFLESQADYMSEAQCAPYIDALCKNLKFLQSIEMADGSWCEVYDHEVSAAERVAMADSSPYFDGESLLAYITALRYFRKHPNIQAPAGLKERVEFALPLLIKKYAVDALAPEGDEAQAKGFYQWGAMASALFCEDYPDSPLVSIASRGTLALTWWQIYSNRVEYREGNTGYAVEGLIAAWRIATQFGHTEYAKTIRATIENIMAKLLTWQVGTSASLNNPFLKYWSEKGCAKRAFGGVLAAKDSGFIRIDNVQHQLHATLLVRKYLYPDNN